MNNEENNFVLSTLTDKENGSIVLKNYEDLLEKANKFIKDNSLFTEPNFENPLEIKACKEERTNLNKAMKTIQSARLAICSSITGTFVEQCMTLEKLCKRASDQHSKAIHAYEEINKKDETASSKKIYQATIYSLDEETLEKVIKYAKKCGCSVA